MVNTIFSTVNSWMTGAPLLAALGSLLWGTVSVVFSPCQIASLPLMVGYVGGQEQRPLLKRGSSSHFSIP